MIDRMEAKWILTNLSAEFSGNKKNEGVQDKYIATLSAIFHLCLGTFVNDIKTMPEILIENISLKLPVASCVSEWLKGKPYC